MMKRQLSIPLAVMLALAFLGCSTAQSETTIDQAGDVGIGSISVPGAPARMSADANSLVSVEEVGLGPNAYVTLNNFTDVPVTLEGTYLCQGNSCFALPSTVIEAGDNAIVAVGSGSGLNSVVATNASVGELRPFDGEIALFASATVSADQMLNYLEWGSTPHALTKLAIDAGLWHEGSYAPTSAAATRLYRVPESGLWLFDAP